MPNDDKPSSATVRHRAGFTPAIEALDPTSPHSALTPNTHVSIEENHAPENQVLSGATTLFVQPVESATPNPSRKSSLAGPSTTFAPLHTWPAPGGQEESTPYPSPANRHFEWTLSNLEPATMGQAFFRADSDHAFRPPAEPDVAPLQPGPSSSSAALAQPASLPGPWEAYLADARDAADALALKQADKRQKASVFDDRQAALERDIATVRSDIARRAKEYTGLKRYLRTDKLLGPRPTERRNDTELALAARRSDLVRLQQEMEVQAAARAQDGHAPYKAPHCPEYPVGRLVRGSEGFPDEHVPFGLDMGVELNLEYLWAAFRKQTPAHAAVAQEHQRRQALVNEIARAMPTTTYGQSFGFPESDPHALMTAYDGVCIRSAEGFPIETGPIQLRRLLAAERGRNNTTRAVDRGATSTAAFTVLSAAAGFLAHAALTLAVERYEATLDKPLNAQQKAMFLSYGKVVLQGVVQALMGAYVNSALLAGQAHAERNMTAAGRPTTDRFQLPQDKSVYQVAFAMYPLIQGALSALGQAIAPAFDSLSQGRQVAAQLATSTAISGVGSTVAGVAAATHIERSANDIQTGILGIDASGSYDPQLHQAMLCQAFSRMERNALLRWVIEPASVCWQYGSTLVRNTLTGLFGTPDTAAREAAKRKGKTAQQVDAASESGGKEMDNRLAQWWPSRLVAMIAALITQALSEPELSGPVQTLVGAALYLERLTGPAAAKAERVNAAARKEALDKREVRDELFASEARARTETQTQQAREHLSMQADMAGQRLGLEEGASWRDLMHRAMPESEAAQRQGIESEQATAFGALLRACEADRVRTEKGKQPNLDPQTLLRPATLSP